MHDQHGFGLGDRVVHKENRKSGQLIEFDRKGIVSIVWDDGYCEMVKVDQLERERVSSAEPSAEDRVKHPRHYTSHPSGIECIQVVQHMNFNIGSAMKYLWRAGLKPGADATEDLQKALEYVEFEIERRREFEPG